MTTFGENFGALVRERRGAKHMSQDDLALEVGMYKARISDLENGKIANPQQRTVSKICAALDISREERTACHPKAADAPAPLPPRLLEVLALRYDDANPDGSEGELEAFLKDKAKEHREMKSRLDALAAAEGRIANLLKAAEGAIEAGEFDEADARLADAEEMQQTEHTLVQVRKQSELRVERARTALLKGDVHRAHTHFVAAAEFFEPFDKNEACELRYRVEDALYQHGLRMGGDGVALSADLLSRNLDHWTKDTNPVNWGATQNSLGAALRNQGTRQEGQGGLTLLAEAVAAYRAALEIRTRDAHPVDWAMTQNNLGIALQNQGTRQDGEAGLTLLVEAVAAYRAALEVRTRDAEPVRWAETQQNLAIAYQAMAEAEPGKAAEHLQTALEAVDESLEVFDPETIAFNYKTATKLRDEILAALDELDG